MYTTQNFKELNLLNFDHLPIEYPWICNKLYYFRNDFVTERLSSEEKQMVSTKLLIKIALFYLHVKL